VAGRDREAGEHRAELARAQDADRHRAATGAFSSSRTIGMTSVP
jgi:hypothetical protein